MSTINGKTVKSASLHEGLFVNGVGVLSKDLVSVQDAGHKSVKMTVDEPFLRLELEEPKSRRPIVTYVPLSNVKNLIVVADPKPAPLPTKE